jgi:hypothetical protein
MKYLLTPVLLLFLSVRTGAQRGTDLDVLPQETLHFHKPAAAQLPPGLFSHFEVIDERPDSARIGVYLITRPLFPNFDRQFVFGEPAAAQIAEYLNRYFARPGGPYTALIVLRSLWLSNANYTRPEEFRNAKIGYEVSHIRLRAELYAKLDSQYIPVFRYDTTLSNKSRFRPTLVISGLENDLSHLFTNLADSASRVTALKQYAGRHISRQEIETFNRSRFDKFADSTASFAAGVYASFEEFQSNAPSIRNFEIKKVKKETLLYLKDASGKSNFSTDAWGYSDGTRLYIMRDGSLWPAWRQRKAFYLYALSDKDKHVTYDANGLANGEPQPDQEQEVCIYTFDPDTGEFY